MFFREATLRCLSNLYLLNRILSLPIKILSHLVKSDSEKIRLKNKRPRNKQETINNANQQKTRSNNVTKFRTRSVSNLASVIITIVNPSKRSCLNSCAWPLRGSAKTDNWLSNAARIGFGISSQDWQTHKNTRLLAAPLHTHQYTFGDNWYFWF